MINLQAGENIIMKINKTSAIGNDNKMFFFTLDHFATVMYEEKKSCFYGWASPINSEKEATDLIQAAKKQYPDAKHHVYAWILSNDVIKNKYSDDREPAGTAGMPVLDALRKNFIENAIVIVIRYFGGILLGGGGLVRAYTTSAVLAIKESEIIKMELCASYDLVATYSDFEKIKRCVHDNTYNIEVKDFSNTVISEISCKTNDKDALIKFIADTSNGRASLIFKGSSYKKSL